MAQKLKSLFQGLPSVLVLRALIFGFAFVLAEAMGFGFIPTAVFLIIAAVLYFRTESGGRSYLISFTAFLILLIFSGMSFGAHLPVILSFFVPASIFFVLLGLKTMFFIYRQRWQYLFQIILLYLLALLFFASDKSDYFLIKFLVMFFIVFIFSWEFFRISDVKTSGLPFTDKIKSAVFAGISALAATELFWVINLLPLGFFNSANIAVLINICLLDILSKYNQKKLTLRTILADLTVLILAVIALFAVSNWSI